MTGIPIVSVSEIQGNYYPFLNQSTFEVHEIIENGKESFVFDSVLELRNSLKELLGNYELVFYREDRKFVLYSLERKIGE